MIRRRPRRGFTLLELCVSSFLMCLLLGLLVSTWHAFGRPAIEVSDRCRVLQAAVLAVSSLASDLGGQLPGARAGSISQARLVGWQTPALTEIWLCYDGDEFADPAVSPDGLPNWDVPDTVVRYYVSGDNLVRQQGDQPPRVVAREVTGLEASLDPVSGNLLFQLAYQHRSASRVDRFEVPFPSP